MVRPLVRRFGGVGPWVGPDQWSDPWVRWVVDEWVPGLLSMPLPLLTIGFTGFVEVRFLFN